MPYFGCQDDSELGKSVLASQVQGRCLPLCPRLALIEAGLSWGVRGQGMEQVVEVTQKPPTQKMH